MRKKNTKKLKIVEISIFVTIVLFVFAITAIYNEKTVKTNTELLSNKKIKYVCKKEKLKNENMVNYRMFKWDW